MIRRSLAALLLLSALPCLGQAAAPLAQSAGTLAERTLNPTGSGASGRLALWSGTGTLTSDAGITYVGSGATAGIALNGDTSLSRISAGVVGVGTGAAGSTAGRLSIAGGSSGAASNAGLIVNNTWGIFHNNAGFGGLVFNSGVSGGYAPVTVPSLAIDNGAANDTWLAKLTAPSAATLQHGAADSATPVAQTIAFQGSRGGTDTNVAGVDATIQGSLGTGTAASGKLVFKVGTPTTTGSTQHTANTVLTLQDTGAGGTPSPAVIAAGPVTSTQFRLSALNTAPSSAADTGTLGEIRIDSGYIYVCTATNTWVRAALATWP